MAFTTASRSRKLNNPVAVKDKTNDRKTSPNKKSPQLPKFPPRTLAKSGNAADGKLKFPPRFLKENVSSGKKK